MRRAITAISFMLFGASALIFISALLIPLLRESTLQGGDSKTEVYKLFGSLKKTIEKSARKLTQYPVVINKLDSSVTQSEGKVEQDQTIGSSTSIQLEDAAVLPSPVASNDNAIDRNRGDSSAMQALQTSPETTIPRIDQKKSPEQANPVGTEEERSPQHEPISLLVLGEGSFSPGEIRPKANVYKAIDKIIPLINARSLDKVLVEGHADKAIPDGFSPAQASKWNKIVSMQRAKAVARALKKKGVASDRIIVNGFGDTVPLASNLTQEGRSKNRRVEIKLSPERQ
ncbi:OmpA family protein [Methylobacter svalbardensis]|uniref:OmpA family protein n=1 Tax=Methylobacter svalbardensis TaxID=3080016 RepID=UPI0030EB598B